MLNILTIDLEDYFQVHAFSRVIKYEDWDNYECRIERNTDRLLEILNDITQNSTFNTQNSKLNDSALNNSITHSLNNSFTRKVQATFFILGWVADRYPGLVRRIQKEGHEIACHGYAHQLVYTQSRDEFRQDIKRAKSILEDITGSEVIGYRAPSYSITNKSRWAFEVLVEEGFKYDSSIFPIRHDFYGMPDAPRFPFIISLKGNNNFEFSMLSCEFDTASLNNSKLSPQSPVLKANSFTHSRINSSSDVSTRQHGSTAALDNSLTHSLINSIPNNSKPQPPVLKAFDVSAPQHGNTRHSLVEFPISTVKLFGANFPISGGGYFRLFPYSLIRKGLKSINQKENKPFIFYVHPWEFDADQPRVRGAANLSKFRHYVNLNKTEEKFTRLLTDFTFSSIREIIKLNNVLT